MREVASDNRVEGFAGRSRVPKGIADVLDIPLARDRTTFAARQSLMGAE